MKKIAYKLNSSNEFELVQWPRTRKGRIIVDQHRINQSEIARKLGFTHSYIQQIICAKFKAPKVRRQIESILFKNGTGNKDVIYLCYKYTNPKTPKQLK